MVTYYNTKDLVKFGNFLMTRERMQSVKATICRSYINQHFKDKEQLIHIANNPDNCPIDILYNKLKGAEADKAIEYVEAEMKNPHRIGVSDSDISNWKNSLG